MKKQRLIWVYLHEKDGMVTPTYFFDFDFLNQLGFPDKYIFDFMREMKRMAKKEIKDRSNENPNRHKGRGISSLFGSFNDENIHQ